MACVSADTVLPVKTISVKQAPLIVMPRYANKMKRPAEGTAKVKEAFKSITLSHQCHSNYEK